MSMPDPEDLEFNLPAKTGRVHSDLQAARRRREVTRQTEIISLLMMGLSYEQIADRMEVSKTDIFSIVARYLRERPKAGVEEMRKIENLRLDRAQAAIWPQVLEGDHKAIDAYLKISSRRSRLNGMDAPLQIELSAHVKIEMQQALAELQQIVLGEVIEEGEVERVNPD